MSKNYFHLHNKSVIQYLIFRIQIKRFYNSISKRLICFSAHYCQNKMSEQNQNQNKTEVEQKILSSETSTFQSKPEITQKNKQKNAKDFNKKNMDPRKQNSENKSKFLKFLCDNLDEDKTVANETLAVEEKIVCSKAKELQSNPQPTRCTVTHEITGYFWKRRNAQTATLIIESEESFLTCWMFTSNSNISKSVYFFGTTLQDGSFGYVTLAGQGNAYKLLPSNVDPTSINIDNNEETNDPRAFYFRSPSSSSSGLLVSASNQQLFAKLLSTTNEVIADYTGDEWFIQ